MRWYAFGKSYSVGYCVNIAKQFASVCMVEADDSPNVIIAETEKREWHPLWRGEDADIVLNSILLSRASYTFIAEFKSGYRRHYN